MLPAIVLSAALAGVAPDPDPDVVAGEAAYRAERWDEASVAFARAYASTGDATYLYTRAQAERRAGRCEIAIELYEEFLRTDPIDSARVAATENIAACRELVPATVDPPAMTDPVEPEASLAAPLEPADPTPPDTTETSRAPPHRFFRDPAGDVLVGLGVAGAVTGGVLVGVAYRSANRASDAPDDRAFGLDLDRAKTLERAGAVALGIGGALLVAGIVRWVIVERRYRRSAAAAWVLPTASGMLVRLP